MIPTSCRVWPFSLAPKSGLIGHLRLCAVVLGILFLNCSFATADAILIDDFTDHGNGGLNGNGLTVESGMGSVSTDDINLSGVIGGGREAILSLQGNANSATLRINGSGLQYVSQGTGDAVFELLYDEFSAPFDLTMNGDNDGIVISVFSHDNNGQFPTTDFTVSLTDSGGSEPVALTLVGQFAGGGTALIFPFTAFSTIDPTDIQSISITVDPTAKTNITLGGIRSDFQGVANQPPSVLSDPLPEPGAIIIWGLSTAFVGGYGWYCRKRRKSLGDCRV